jgi:hypothetical protein
MNARLLLFGRDENLLSARSSVLARYGFPVITAYTLADVERCAREYPVAMFALCHSASAEDRRKAIALVRRYCPDALTLNIASLPHTAVKSTHEPVFTPRPLPVVEPWGQFLPPAGTF